MILLRHFSDSVLEWRDDLTLPLILALGPFILFSIVTIYVIHKMRQAKSPPPTRHITSNTTVPSVSSND